jgi:hypothetical protein
MVGDGFEAAGAGVPVEGVEQVGQSGTSLTCGGASPDLLLGMWRDWSRLSSPLSFSVSLWLGGNKFDDGLSVEGSMPFARE